MIDRPALRALLSLLENQPRNDPDDDLVRRGVRLRAGDVCEYCFRRTANPFHIDHIIPSALWQSYVSGLLVGIPPVVGRRGPDHLENFAWSCPLCNRSKSQHVTARINGQSQRLFDPWHDYWPEHFSFMNHYLFIAGVTTVGIATEHVLNLNGGGLNGPLGMRHEAIVEGRYPPDWARDWIV